MSQKDTEITASWEDQDTGESGTFTAHPDASVGETLREQGIRPDVTVWVEDSEESK